MWTRAPRRIAAMALLLAAVSFGLFLAFSQTSFLALLAGVGVLCALRYSLKWTIVAAPFAIVAVAAAVLVVGGTSEAENDAEEISSGRTTLIDGGVNLFKSEPLVGHGSASFSDAFAEQEDISTNKTTISHNEPVTVAAEQGTVGLLAYVGLLGAAAWTLLAGTRRLAPGFGAPSDAVGDPFEGSPAAERLARLALIGGFAALVVHTVGYAGYLTDPLTWALLAVGGALAASDS
jgi:O-antigen ligase